MTHHHSVGGASTYLWIRTHENVTRGEAMTWGLEFCVDGVWLSLPPQAAHYAGSEISVSLGIRKVHLSADS